MKTTLILACVAAFSGTAFGQGNQADRLLLETYLMDHRQGVVAAEATATFIRDQLAALRGKLDYYADPAKSKVHSREDLKRHFADLSDPVREATTRIYGLKETLDSLALSFGGSAPPNEPALIRLLPDGKYEYRGDTVDLKTLKSKLNRSGSLDAYMAVKISISPTDSASALATVVAACQAAQVRYVWFDEHK